MKLAFQHGGENPATTLGHCGARTAVCEKGGWPTWRPALKSERDGMAQPVTVVTGGARGLGRATARRDQDSSVTKNVLGFLSPKQYLSLTGPLTNFI